MRFISMLLRSFSQNSKTKTCRMQSQSSSTISSTLLENSHQWHLRFSSTRSNQILNSDNIISHCSCITLVWRQRLLRLLIQIYSTHLNSYSRQSLMENLWIMKFHSNTSSVWIHQYFTFAIKTMWWRGLDTLLISKLMTREDLLIMLKRLFLHMNSSWVRMCILNR